MQVDLTYLLLDSSKEDNVRNVMDLISSAIHKTNDIFGIVDSWENLNMFFDHFFLITLIEEDGKSHTLYLPSADEGFPSRIIARATTTMPQIKAIMLTKASDILVDTTDLTTIGFNEEFEKEAVFGMQTVYQERGKDNEYFQTSVDIVKFQLQELDYHDFELISVSNLDDFHVCHILNHFEPIVYKKEFQEHAQEELEVIDMLLLQTIGQSNKAMNDLQNIMLNPTL